MTILNYNQQGSGENIILIHGLLGSLENLNMVTKGLKDNYCVTSVDVRNHGNSFQKNTMDYAELAQDIIALLNHLNINKCILLGHSMGGKIAMQVALEFPERVSQLIIADISPVQYPAHHQKILEGLKAIDLPSISSRKDADNQLSPYVKEIGVRQFLLRNLISDGNNWHFKCNLDYINNCYPQIMMGYQGEAQFSGPTLFIKGGDSNYILPEHRQTIIKLFPTSSAKIIQGAGHWLHAEKTTIFNKIVLDFLAKNTQ
ncbi:alpha/beta fold hydrolase [Thalassotalea profundi]|uniref:Acyl-CoA esterase n=1 Tax=Thalassotalea profundi TaxID=2036687 RepID=A0ABQ3IB08_9GAMM|nr:alpha/beta fold hydrolase [Thalassotalea profundi]GHE77337.1 acyl-CoA esterase [Thalassotalea profundi]